MSVIGTASLFAFSLMAGAVVLGAASTADAKSYTMAVAAWNDGDLRG